MGEKVEDEKKMLRVSLKNWQDITIIKAERNCTSMDNVISHLLEPWRKKKTKS